MNTRPFETETNVVQFPKTMKRPTSEPTVFDREEDVKNALDNYLDNSLDAVSESIVTQIIESRADMSTLEIFMTTKEKTRTLKLNLERLKFYLDEMESVEILQK
ncbi:MAG: hypothetical protein ACOYL6_07860 [Bacteriovoracaceae bacterium]